MINSSTRAVLFLCNCNDVAYRVNQRPVCGQFGRRKHGSPLCSYFSIGVRRLRKFAGAHPDLVIFHGNKYLIFREKMEEYIAFIPQGENGKELL